MTLLHSALGRVIRASLAPLFLSTLVIGCGPSDVGTIKTGSKGEETNAMLPTEGAKKPLKKGVELQGGPTAPAPGKKR
jgi:hypothetical protein